MPSMSGRRVVVASCGSIAAYKTAEVVRGLIRDGADVRAVMTPSATRFLGPATLAALTGSQVHTDLFEAPERVIHVELGRWAEAFVVCGATASTLSRLAGGSGSDIVSATYLMRRCPVVIAPAMHSEMWEHASVVRNVDRLKADGAAFVGPATGDLASGDVGVGRLAEPDDIVEEVRTALAPADLAGLRVLVTAGPTREPLDPVRYISNRSSGRMGWEIAREATRRGAEVTLVHGPTALQSPWRVRTIEVQTAEEMLSACLDVFEEMDVAVMNAAVADYRPASAHSEKVRKTEMDMTVRLDTNPDIAAELGRKKGAQIVVAFAAETADAVDRGRRKLETKHADMIVANTVGAPGTGFDTDTNDAWFILPDGVEELPRLGKDDLAGRIWDRIVELRGTRGV